MNIRKVIDIGTGSGCIGLTLLGQLNHEIELWLTDISLAALEVAKLNYQRFEQSYNYGHKVLFYQIDRLKQVEQKFECIISNPPYIDFFKDRAGVHRQVDQYEPALALYIKENYQQWFKDFFSQVENSLLTGGIFIMEGHEDHLQEQLIEIKLNFNYKNLQVVKDYTNRDRFLIWEK